VRRPLSVEVATLFGFADIVLSLYDFYIILLANIISELVYIIYKRAYHSYTGYIVYILVYSLYRNR